MKTQLTDELTEQEIIPLTLAPVLIAALSFMAVLFATLVMPATCSGTVTETCALGTTVAISAIFAIVGLWVVHTLRSMPEPSP